MVGRMRWRDEMQTMLDEYGQLRTRLAALRDTLAALTATATSADGTVTVTVGPQGGLVGLTIAPAAAAGSRRLADRILATSAQASASVSVLAREAMRDAVPDRMLFLLDGGAGPSEPAWLDPAALARPEIWR